MTKSVKGSAEDEIKITFSGPILPGSVSTAMARCAKKTCKCRDDPSQRHGPYYRWTGLIDGKKTTVTPAPEEAKECQRRIKNFKKPQAVPAKMVQAALEAAPRTQR
jgi:hypothetical protein